MPKPSKIRLEVLLAEWGLIVEGDEYYEELYEAFQYLRSYRQSRALPAVLWHKPRGSGMVNTAASESSESSLVGSGARKG